MQGYTTVNIQIVHTDDNWLAAQKLADNTAQQNRIHYCDVIMGKIASQITNITIVYSSLFGRRSTKMSKLRVTGLCAGNSPGTGESPGKRPVTRKMFPFDDVIMRFCGDMMRVSLRNILLMHGTFLKSSLPSYIWINDWICRHETLTWNIRE